jgi:hypothetical protein
MLPPKSINFGASCSSDNLNDVEAGLSNSVHFIGFSANLHRLNEMKRAGASHLSNNHLDTFRLIGHLLGK